VEDVLALLPRKTRAAARKGLDLLGEDSAVTGPELLDVIYDLYSVTLRRLGSPNYRREFFHSLLSAYGDDCVCLVVRDAGKPVAGVVSFIFRDEIVPYFSGSLDEGMTKNANNVMYLRLMEYAVGRGLKWFDFNRTRRDNTGPHAFKRYHGFEPAPLHYQVYLHNGKSKPNLSPSNKKFALAGRAWSKMPLWLTRSAGSTISKWIP
jgi:FemAB-related protein (PEP-CTERM system-associated)